MSQHGLGSAITADPRALRYGLQGFTLLFPPQFHNPMFVRFLFAADTCNISHWGCNKMLNINGIYGVLQIMKFNVIFLEVIKTLSDSQ